MTLKPCLKLLSLAACVACASAVGAKNLRGSEASRRWLQWDAMPSWVHDVVQDVLPGRTKTKTKSPPKPKDEKTGERPPKTGAKVDATIPLVGNVGVSTQDIIDSIQFDPATAFDALANVLGFMQEGEEEEEEEEKSDVWGEDGCQFLASVCDESSLEGTLCAAVHECCDRDEDFNECMGEATMDGLDRLAEAGAAVARGEEVPENVTTLFDFRVNPSITLEGPFGSFVTAEAEANFTVYAEDLAESTESTGVGGRLGVDAGAGAGVVAYLPPDQNDLKLGGGALANALVQGQSNVGGGIGPGGAGVAFDTAGESSSIVAGGATVGGVTGIPGSPAGRETPAPADIVNGAYATSGAFAGGYVNGGASVGGPSLAAAGIGAGGSAGAGADGAVKALGEEVVDYGAGVRAEGSTGVGGEVIVGAGVGVQAAADAKGKAGVAGEVNVMDQKIEGNATAEGNVDAVIAAGVSPVGVGVEGGVSGKGSLGVGGVKVEETFDEKFNVTVPFGDIIP